MSKAHAFYAHKRMDPPRMILLYAYTVEYFTARQVVVGMQAEVTRVVEEKKERRNTMFAEELDRKRDRPCLCFYKTSLESTVALMCIPSCLARSKFTVYRKDRRSLPRPNCEVKITYPSLDPSNRSIYRMPYSLFLSVNDFGLGGPVVGAECAMFSGNPDH